MSADSPRSRSPPERDDASRETRPRVDDDADATDAFREAAIQFALGGDKYAALGIPDMFDTSSPCVFVGTTPDARAALFALPPAGGRGIEEGEILTLYPGEDIERPLDAALTPDALERAVWVSLDPLCMRLADAATMRALYGAAPGSLAPHQHKTGLGHVARRVPTATDAGAHVNATLVVRESSGGPMVFLCAARRITRAEEIVYAYDCTLQPALQTERDPEAPLPSLAAPSSGGDGNAPEDTDWTGALGAVDKWLTAAGAPPRTPSPPPLPLAETGLPAPTVYPDAAVHTGLQRARLIHAATRNSMKPPGTHPRVADAWAAANVVTRDDYAIPVTLRDRGQLRALLRMAPAFRSALVVHGTAMDAVSAARGLLETLRDAGGLRAPLATVLAARFAAPLEGFAAEFAAGGATEEARRAQDALARAVLREIAVAFLTRAVHWCMRAGIKADALAPLAKGRAEQQRVQQIGESVARTDNWFLFFDPARLSD